MTPAATRGPQLDGAWWPRSADPVAELPGLVLALDERLGRVERITVSAFAWACRPRRIVIGDRVITLGWYSAQPVSLLTAAGTAGRRLELLVIPPDTATESARAAMAVAADPANTFNASGLLAAVVARPVRDFQEAAMSTWESEGGNLKTRK